MRIATHASWRQITFKDGLRLRPLIEIYEPSFSEFWEDRSGTGFDLWLSLFVMNEEQEDEQVRINFEESADPRTLFNWVTISFEWSSTDAIGDMLEEAFTRSILERGELTFCRNMVRDDLDDDPMVDQSENVVLVDLVIGGNRFTAVLDREASVRLFEYTEDEEWVTITPSLA
ncbi:MAG: hypothetical protein O2877_00765 [bacterium]|nr:hypothetical protein [bacterium]